MSYFYDSAIAGIRRNRKWHKQVCASHSDTSRLKYVRRPLRFAYYGSCSDCPGAQSLDK